MPITLDSLRTSARQPAPLRKTLAEATNLGLPRIFLCHSHQDKEFVQGLIKQFDEAGWKIYVDWEDAAMPDVPDAQTAARIQRKIVEVNYFVFLATPNSMNSRWCPWEIGYADGKKLREQILIVPTVDSSGRSHGNEYLQLYRRVEPGFLQTQRSLALYEVAQNTGRWLSSI
jgi:hypothetical protein